MERIAVLVDAGYLFAQGVAAIGKPRTPRKDVELDIGAVTHALVDICKKKAPSATLLRIYWYDAISAKYGPSAEQARLAEADNIKLRIGFLNSVGEQKGVDSLIVIDLIDLARNRAACDVVLVSGDEDVRVGVALAQSHGVRIHLVGIVPSRGSQSPALRQEADTLSEISSADVARFLKLRAGAPASKEPLAGTKKVAAAKLASPPGAAPPKSTLASEPVESQRDVAAILAELVEEIWASLSDADRDGYTKLAAATSGVPQQLDGKLLSMAKEKLRRLLTMEERHHLRGMVKKRLAAP